MQQAAVGERSEARRHAQKASSHVLARRSGRRTLYDVLQVSPTADEQVIQAAYRALARAHHPDLNADPAAPLRMRELNEAYNLLSDPRERARYDLDLQEQRTVRRAAEPGPIVRHRSCGCQHPGQAGPAPGLAARAQLAAGWVVAGLVLIAWIASRVVGIGS